MQRARLITRTPVRSRWARIAGGLALMLTTVACDALLEVDDPDIIEPRELQSLDGAEAAYSGAIGDFAVAKDGSAGGLRASLGLVQAGGWFTDEFVFAGTGRPSLRAMDLRELDPDVFNWAQLYQNLHVARAGAERAAELFRKVSPDPVAEPRIGELYAISALVHVMMGEHYCQGIPFGDAVPDLVYGAPLDSDQVMDRALERLDLAAQFSGGSADVSNLARVVLGRALLNKGDFAGAGEAVTGVPTDFTYASLHSGGTERQSNMMYVENHELEEYSVADVEGVNGLDFATAGDPRVPTEFLGPSKFDGVTPMYLYLTLTSRAAPVQAASGIEARLIEAEAQLQDGLVADWLTTLNDARGTLGMSALTDPGSADARVDLMFRERAFWLFNTGHRLGDLRRLVRQYGRDPLSVYPVGDYHKDNLTRGDALTLVIPSNEDNNPLYVPCSDGIA